MVDWMRIGMNVAIFIVGGFLALCLKPLLSIATVLIMLTILSVFLLGMALPAGWFLSYIGIRLGGMLLFTRIGMAIGFLILGAFLAVIQPAYGDLLLFSMGGVASLMLFSPIITPGGFTRRLKPIRGAARTRGIEVKKIKVKGLLDKNVLTIDHLRSGIIVTGEEAIDVGRLLIYELVKKLGRKVIIIGESSKLIPEGVSKVVGGKADSINVVDDLIKDPNSVEDFVYALALANKLRNDDIPFLLVGAGAVVRDVQAGRISKEDMLNSIPDQIQDRRGVLIKNVLSLCDFIGTSGLSYTSLKDDWSVLYISLRGLPQRQATFAAAYTLYMLRRYDAVLVLHNPERLVMDINLLGYDSRESWERAFHTLTSWKDKGLIIISRSPIASPSLLKLCPVMIATRMPEVPRVEGEWLRSLLINARDLESGELMLSTSNEVVKVKYRAPNPARIPPPKTVKKPVKRLEVAVAAQAGVSSSVEERVEAPPGPTPLEKEYGEKVMDVARLLQSAKSGLERINPEDEALVKQLENKGLLTRFGGTYYTSAMGLELLNEYQKAVKERGMIAVEEGGEEEAQPPAETGVAQTAKPVQTVIDSKEALERLDEWMASYYMAESLFRQGKYAQSIMKSYDFMLNSLKGFYNIEKGHLDDVVEQLNERGVQPLSTREAKDAKTIMIEASKALKEGGRTSLISAQRMLRYAKKVFESLSETGESNR